MVVKKMPPKAKARQGKGCNLRHIFQRAAERPFRKCTYSDFQKIYIRLADVLYIYI